MNFVNEAVYCHARDSEYPHFLREAFPRPLPDGPFALCPAGAFLNPDFFAILSPPEMPLNFSCSKTKQRIQDTTLELWRCREFPSRGILSFALSHTMEGYVCGIAAIHSLNVR